MAKEKPAPAPAPAEPAPAKKKLPIVPIVGVLTLLIIEGVAIFVIVGGAAKPSETHGAELQEAHMSEGDKLVEILVVKDKFPNNSTGRSWLWDVEIQVQVKTKNMAQVQEVLASRSAEIKTGLARIWRTAQHNYFNEPSLETLTRQVKRLLDDIMDEGTAKFALAAGAAPAPAAAGGHGAPPSDGHGAPAGGHDEPAADSHGGSHGAGEAAIERVLIPRCVGFPTDY